MKIRLLLLPLLGIFLLGGCRARTCFYSFETIIDGDGNLVRTIAFGLGQEAAEETESDEDAVEAADDEAGAGAESNETAQPAAPESDGTAGEPSAEKAVRLRSSLPDALVLPDRTRFETYELTEEGLKGTWRSDGLIHTDFRYVTPSYTESDDPISRPTEPVHIPFTVRQAYNEGRVTVSDLGLVKAVNYSEKFHDFYTREEFDEYADTLIDIRAQLFFDVVRDAFTWEHDPWGGGESYYVWDFYNVLMDRGVPVVKKWKEYFYREFVVGTSGSLDDSEVRQPGSLDIADMLTAEKLALTHDLMQIGVVDDPHFDAELLLEKAREWIVDQMSTEIWRSTADDEGGDDDDEELDEEDEGLEEDVEAPLDSDAEELEAEEDDEDDMFLSVSEIEDFLDEGFEEIYNSHLKSRYGSDEYYRKHLANIYRSFAEESGHVFRLRATMPGHVVRVLPEPASTERVDGGTLVQWRFDEKSFFPDGVLLSAVSVIPNREVQESLYGEVALADPEAMTRYVALVLQLPGEQRTYFLDGLQAAVEHGALDEFVENLRWEYPRVTENGKPVVEPIHELTDLLEALHERSKPPSP